MTKWKNMLAATGVACAVGFTANLVHAENEFDSERFTDDVTEETAACVRCDHSKGCSAVDCADPAHAAVCVCIDVDSDKEDESIY